MSGKTPSKPTKAPAQEEKKNPPVFKKRVGSCEVSVWEQAGKKENTTFLTVSMRRNFKDKDGNWQETGSLRINDIPDMKLALDSAYEYAKVTVKEKKASESSDEEEIVM